MEITPVGEASVKIANQWKQITDSWVKISGSWKKLDKIYIKTKNNWSLVSGAGADLEISAYTVDYGRSTRPYS
jgi:hypothetical protein